MVKGFVAEYHFEMMLKDLKGRGLIDDYNRIDKDGQPDFKVIYKGLPHLVEVKLFMTNGGKPDRYKVDFQRTRNSPGDPLSRFYRRSDFDILAACTYNRNGRWDFLYIKTSELPLDEKAGEDCLKKAVYHDLGNARWALDFLTVISSTSQRGEVSSKSIPLDRYPGNII